MNRWDLLNYFIRKHNCEHFLEIGYYKGWSFDRVECCHKTAVDPAPCKTPEQEAVPPGGELVFQDDSDPTTFHRLLKTTSDAFFASLDPQTRFEVVFIDGLHEADQVERDIQHALQFMEDGGIVVLHDCNPPLEGHTTSGIDGCWTGDTYRAIMRFRKNNTEHTFYTIDSDWGLGVIIKGGGMIGLQGGDYDLAQTSWSYFDENRKLLLNLKDVKWFYENN